MLYLYFMYLDEHLYLNVNYIYIIILYFNIIIIFF